MLWSPCTNVEEGILLVLVVQMIVKILCGKFLFRVYLLQHHI